MPERSSRLVKRDWSVADLSPSAALARRIAADGRPGKFRSIQALRGVAATLVVLNHVLITLTSAEGNHAITIPNSLAAFGAVGVDIFFVISGFIMLGILDSGPARRLDLRDFAIKRFIRIMPLYWIYTLLYLAFMVAARFSNGGLHAVLDYPGFAGAYLLKSLLLIPTLSPVETDHIRPFLEQGWTLPYEIYFYVLFGLFAVKAQGRLTLILWISATIALVWSLARPALTGTVMDEFFGNAIVFEFILGMLAYRLVSRTDRYAGSSLAVGLLLLGVSAFIPISLEWRSLFWGLPAFLIVYGLSGLEKKVNWWSPLIVLGDCSYSLYLMHPIIIGLYHGVLKRKVIGSAAIELASIPLVIAICVIASIGAYIMIEKPMLGLLNRLYRRIAKAERPVDEKLLSQSILLATENGQ